MIYYLLSEEVYIYHNGNVSVTMGMCLRAFEAWAKLAQQCVLCVPLRIHLEQFNRVNAVCDNNIIIIINCAIWPKKRTLQYQIRRSLGQ